MKQLLFGIFLVLGVRIKAQIVNIPDANFKNALLNHDPVIDTNNDGEISVAEAQGFTGEMEVDNKNISDLTGIEAFVNLKDLNCFDNQLTSLDISNGNNFNLIYFNTVNNPDLSCVTVDNQTESRNWQKQQDVWYTDNENASEKELVNAAINGLGLSELEEFIPQKRIIEWALRGE